MVREQASCPTKGRLQCELSQLRHAKRKEEPFLTIYYRQSVHIFNLPILCCRSVFSFELFSYLARKSTLREYFINLGNVKNV